MSSAFDQLTEGLSPEEKRQLLEKIQSSLNWSQKDAETVAPHIPPKEEIYKSLKKDAEKMSFFKKLIYRIVSFFMVIRFEELLLRSKIHELKKNVDKISHGLIYWERGQLSEVMGKAIWDLYVVVWPLIPVFNEIGKKNAIIEKTVTDLLEAIIPSPKTSVFDLVSLSEMADIYRTSGQKEKIHKRVRDSIPPYLDQISEEHFKKVKEFIGPIYYLKHLVLYPFHVLLQAFGVVVSDDEPTECPPLRPAFVRGLTDFIEKLYYSLYLANKINYQEATWRPLFQNYINTTGEKTYDVDAYVKFVKNLFEESQSIFGEVPWKDIIQALNENPYYSLRFFTPQFDVKSFYRASLVVRFSEQVEDIFPELRKSVIEKEKNALFPNQNSQLFSHYNWESNSEIRALGGSGFRHVDSLNLVNTFLQTHYLQQVLPLFQTLSRVVLQTFKSLNSSLLDVLSQLEDFRAMLIKFDKSLSPEGNDGVTLMRLKQELKNKLLATRNMNEFTQKKDKEAAALIDKSYELFSRARKILEEIYENNSEKMKTSLKLPYIMGGAKRSIKEAIQEKIETINNMLHLVNDLFTEESQGD